MGSDVQNFGIWAIIIRNTDKKNYFSIAFISFGGSHSFKRDEEWGKISSKYFWKNKMDDFEHLSYFSWMKVIWLLQYQDETLKLYFPKIKSIFTNQLDISKKGKLWTCHHYEETEEVEDLKHFYI